MADDFYLFANCNFVPDKYADCLTQEQWQAAYDTLAEYVQSSEHTTKTYYFGIPLDYAHDFSKTTSMLAFEIYGKRDDLYETHLNSPAMSKFLSLIPGASTTDLDLNHYALTSGFLDLDGSAKPAGVMQDIQIVTNTASSRDSVLSHLKTLVSTVEQKERSNGSGTLTYMGFKSLDDETGVRIFGRWSTREDLERFVRREEVGRFWERVKQDVRSMGQRLYLENGKGWLHKGSGYAGEDGGTGKANL